MHSSFLQHFLSTCLAYTYQSAMWESEQSIDVFQVDLMRVVLAQVQIGLQMPFFWWNNLMYLFTPVFYVRGSAEKLM